MAKSCRSRKISAPRRSWALIAIVFVAAGAALFYVYGRPLVGTAEAATAYSARVACSCRFVAERDLSDCNKDKLEGMEWVSLSEDAEARSVTASIPLLASDTATLRDGYGCVLQPWQHKD